MKRKMMKIRLSLAFLSLIATTSALAGTNNMFGTWTSITLQGDFSAISPEAKKFRWMIIDQVRTRDDKDLNPSRYPDSSGIRFSENLLWLQGGYNLTEHSSVWLGYAHDWVKQLNGGHFEESRPYQDYLWSQKIFGDFTATMRSRLEERIAITGPNSGDFGLRVRQLAMLKHPIVNKLSIFVGDEVFVNLNNSSFSPGGFDQNRAFGGLSYQVTPQMDLALGYLGQFINTKSGNDLFTHNLLFDVSYKF